MRLTSTAIMAENSASSPRSNRLVRKIISQSAGRIGCFRMSMSVFIVWIGLRVERFFDFNSAKTLIERKLLRRVLNLFNKKSFFRPSLADARGRTREGVKKLKFWKPSFPSGISGASRARVRRTQKAQNSPSFPAFTQSIQKSASFPLREFLALPLQAASTGRRGSAGASRQSRFPRRLSS